MWVGECTQKEDDVSALEARARSCTVTRGMAPGNEAVSASSRWTTYRHYMWSTYTHQSNWCCKMSQIASPEGTAKANCSQVKATSKLTTEKISTASKHRYVQHCRISSDAQVYHPPLLLVCIRHTLTADSQHFRDPLFKCIQKK